jgi:hypothetical protein
MPEWLKEVGRWILSFLIVALVMALVYLDWSGAKQYTHDAQFRLRWYTSPREAVTAGSLIKKEQLRPRLAWIHSNLHLTPADEMIGRYALQPIESAEAPQDEPSKPGFSQLAIHTPPPGGAIVSVEVATDHVVTLEPGTAIAFAKEKTVLPGANELCRKHDHPMVLLAVTPSTRDPKSTALTVAVPDCCLDLIPALSAGQWRPVLFSTAKVVPSANTQLRSSTPSQKKGEHKVVANE